MLACNFTTKHFMSALNKEEINKWQTKPRRKPF